MASKERPRVESGEAHQTVRKSRLGSNASPDRVTGAAPRNPDEIARKPTASPAYEEWSRDDLYRKAREVGIDGRSKMPKWKLIYALRHH